MNLSDLTPDTALAALLDGKVAVQISATKKYPIHAYGQAQQPQIVNPPQPVEVNIQGRIEFRHVWFAYEKEDYILKDVNFVIHPGEKIFSAEAREDCKVPNCSASSWIGSKKELM